MEKPLIKICGITNLEDASLCLEQGADFLGFIFYEASPRFIHPEEAKQIIKEARLQFGQSAKFVGVFVNSHRDFVNNTAELLGLDVLQFHGEELPPLVEGFKQKTIKAFRLREEKDLEVVNNYQTDFFLFDTFSKSCYGGTGKIFDWQLLKEFPFKEKMFLSGGINKENITKAWQEVNPFAFDLSSSLEEKPGKKDKKKVEDFFNLWNKLRGDN